MTNPRYLQDYTRADRIKKMRATARKKGYCTRCFKAKARVIEVEKRGEKVKKTLTYCARCAAIVAGHQKDRQLENTWAEKIVSVFRTGA